ncbi:MAG: hypothetical protein ACRDOH_16455 [Streptosporangiaceae bacterium]
MASTTVRLWLDRHHRPPAVRRRRLVLALSALLAMALGAGVTLAFTQRGPESTVSRLSGPAQSPNALQMAAAVRHQAAVWIGQQVGSSILVGCDPEMCDELQNSAFPAGQLNELQPSAPDPLGSVLVVATPVIRNQFGARLASVYAPLVIASFGSGAERVDIRYVTPENSAAAFESQLAADRRDRIAAGEQLLTNQRIQASAAVRQALLAGQVDPRLLITLSTLAHQMPLHLVAFDDPSPGASPDVPLRGAELGAAPAGLAAMVAFLNAQQTPYRPAMASITQIAKGQSVVNVRYDAPSPMGLGGS